MKLLVLKLCSLLTIAVGIIGLAFVLNVPQLAEFLANNAEWLPATPEESIARFAGWLASAAVVTLLGIYGFVPKMGREKAKTREIHFEGEHGDVAIQLDSVQRALTNVIGRMPEVKRVQVSVSADKEGRRALINADVVLYSNPDVRARQTAHQVTEYISQSAINILGLEDLATIKLNVVGFEVNPKLVSKKIRADYKERMEAEKRPKLTYEPPTEDTASKTSAAGIISAAAAIAPAPAPEAEAEEIPTVEDAPVALEEIEDDDLNAFETAESDWDSGELDVAPLEETPVDETATDEALAEETDETPSDESNEEPKKKSWFS